MNLGNRRRGQSTIDGLKVVQPQSSNLLYRKSRGPGMGLSKTYKGNRSLENQNKDSVKKRPALSLDSSDNEDENGENDEAIGAGTKSKSDGQRSPKKQKPGNMFKNAKLYGVHKVDDLSQLAKSKRIEVPKQKTEKELEEDRLLKEIMGENGHEDDTTPNTLKLSIQVPHVDGLAEKMKGRMSSLDKPRAKVGSNGAPRTQKIKNEMSAEELKIQDESDRFNNMLKCLNGSDESKKFNNFLRENKVKKQVSEKELVDIDYDEDIDAGFNNTFEEMNEKKNFNKQKTITEKKYKDKKYPGSLSKEELHEKIKKHMKCVPQIINGKIASPYYGHASDIAKNSTSTALSSSEFLRLPIREFTIGFYGIKRQSVMATYLRKEFGQELEECLLTNKTMQFWSLDSFVFYVLSCDVAMRMAASELYISTGEAFDLLYETVDYGKYITDPVPI